MSNKNRIDRHHNVAKQRGWTHHSDNITYIQRKQHELLHCLHWNDLPHEQIYTILTLSWRPFKKDIKEQLLDVFEDKDYDEIYYEHCIKPNYR